MNVSTLLKRAVRDAILYNEDYLDACSNCTDMDTSKTESYLRELRIYRKRRWGNND